MQFVQFEKVNGTLHITLTDEGRAELAELADNPSSLDLFPHLIEHQLGNGWERILPEEVGWITDATILTDDCTRDENGKLVTCGRVYSNIDYYQIESDVERLLRLGRLVWKGVE